MTLLLVPGPEPDAAHLAPHRVWQAVNYDQVTPQISSGGKTFITFITRSVFLDLELTQNLGVISLRVLDQGSLGYKVLATESAGKVPATSMLLHVNLQVVRLFKYFPTHLARQNFLSPVSFYLVSAHLNMFQEPLVVWAEGKPISTRGTEGLAFFVMDRSYMTFQAAALKNFATNLTKRLLLHSFRYRFCVLFLHMFFKVGSCVKNNFTKFALCCPVFAKNVILELLLLREEQTTEVARDVLLQLLVDLSLVTSQTGVGLEVRLANVTDKGPVLGVSLQVGFQPPLVTQHFQANRT